MALRQLTLIYFAGDCTNKFPHCNQCDGIVLLPKDPDILLTGVSHIIATIVNGPPWDDEALRYDIEFDDAVLVDPTMQLAQCDFRIFCYDDYARFLTANLAVQGIQVGETPSLDLDINGVLITGNVKLSATPGNTLSIQPDGLLSSFAETPLTPVDTQSVNLTATGTSNHTLQADVIISALAGNQVSIAADGLFVPQFVETPETPLAVVDTLTVDLTSSGTLGHTVQADVRVSTNIANQIQILPDGLYVAPDAPETGVIVVDTQSVNLTSSGVNGHTIQADVNISAVAGNQVTLNPDGLYVAGFVETPLTVVDTTTVNLTSSGVSGHTVQADVIISPNVGNQLSNPGNGLFVPAVVQTPLTVVDTTTVNLTNCGVDGHTVQADVIISPNAGNQLSNPGNGLFVAATVQTPLTVVDTSTVNLTSSGVDGHTVQADVIISPTAGNQLINIGNGLYVPDPGTDTLVDNGNRTFTHTSVDGIAVTFCQGIQTVRNDTACAGAGVGATKVIEAASFNGCELILQAEAKSYLSGAAASACAPGFLTPNGAGVFDLNGIDLNVVINNPSPCRQMDGWISTYIGTELFSPLGGTRDYAVRVSTMNSPNPPLYNQISRSTEISATANWRMSGGGYDQMLLNERGGFLPPSSARTIQVRTRLETFPGNQNTAIDFNCATVRLLGWAMNT